MPQDESQKRRPWFRAILIALVLGLMATAGLFRFTGRASGIDESGCGGHDSSELSANHQPESRSGDCIDPDSSSRSPFNLHQLLVRSMTTMGSEAKADQCATIDGATFLHEYVCKGGKIARWETKCSVLDNVFAGGKHACIEGACVDARTTIARDRPRSRVVNHLGAHLF
jgi:hypothetical protein